jgi:hypothetical protein
VSLCHRVVADINRAIGSCAYVHAHYVKHNFGCDPCPQQGATWPQAVQWMEELEVAPGMRLPLTASHDTYGISFSRGTPDAPAEHRGAEDGDTQQCADATAHDPPAAVPTGVPLQVCDHQAPQPLVAVLT